MRKTSQVIWITGASSGIGAALARLLSRQGHRLILSARSEDELQEVRRQCADPVQVAVLVLDLQETRKMPEIVERALGFFGPVDILVNNAGLSQRSLIADTGMEVYRTLMEVNYLGTVALSKALLPEFLRRGSGRFVTVTSLMGKFGSPLRSGYCGAKHALHGFFDVLRMEHEKDGVKVTLICPGFVQTDIARNALTADGSPQKKQDTATAGGLTPETFAAKLWRAVERDRWETYIGKREILGVYLKRFFPRLLHRVVMRSRVV